ncbi:Carboxylesterase [Xylariomycetidae sp. FL2044]|nr:Carboxylesterase [Xylariomycetidae sp. FL2044]
MRSFGSLASWLLVAATTTTVRSMADSSLVQTEYGPVYTENRTASGVAVYKGIPFAAPPVGDLRWRSPRPPSPWTEPLNATEVKTHCYFFTASGPFNPPSTPSEDCLYLNIWTTGSSSSSSSSPASASAHARNDSSHGSLLPVMVWIHGGGFETDSATSPRYDGTRFAEQGVVLVSFNYRLGNLGFLARPDLDENEDDPDARSGNFGLQDMIMALRWVRANAARFGGDPTRVTAFGESAGGHALGLLVASPRAEGLFDRAILQSVAWGEANFGIGSTAAELRRLPVETVVNTSAWVAVTDPQVTAFSPSIDGYVVPAAPGSILASSGRGGEQMMNNVSLMAGWCAREDTIFRTFALAHADAAIWNAARDAFFSFTVPDSAASDILSADNDIGRDAVAAASLFYPANSSATAKASAYQLVADLVIAQQTWEAAYDHYQGRLEATTITTTDADSDDGVRSPPPPPPPPPAAYVYRFTYTSAFNPVAGHSTELPFLFRTFLPEPQIPGYAFSEVPDAEDMALGEAMMAYWTNFAKSGDPNLPVTGLPAWPAYVPPPVDDAGVGDRAGTNMLLELGNEISATEVSEHNRFSFIRSLRSDGVLPEKWRDSPAGTLPGLLAGISTGTWGPINDTIIASIGGFEF